MLSFIQGPYRLHRSVLNDALQGGECPPMNPARGRAPRTRQSRGRTRGCRHPTRVRSILTPKASFRCRLHKLAPGTATSHAGAQNAIPRFCADVAKPCSFPLMRHIFSARSRNLIVAARYFRTRFGARARGAQRTHLPLPAVPKGASPLVPDRNSSLARLAR
jgi:hypothetical protein